MDGGLGGGRARGVLHVIADGHFWDYVHLCTDPFKVPATEAKVDLLPHQRRVRLGLRLQHRHPHLPPAPRLPGGGQGVARAAWPTTAASSSPRPSACTTRASTAWACGGWPTWPRPGSRWGWRSPASAVSSTAAASASRRPCPGRCTSPSNQRAGGGAGARRASSPPGRPRCRCTPPSSTWPRSTC